MNPKRWSSGKLLVLLAGLIITAHQTIPHHHHYDFACSDASGIPDDERDDGFAGNGCKDYCHAFNETVFDDIHPAGFHFSLVPAGGAQDLPLFPSFVPYVTANLSVERPDDDLLFSICVCSESPFRAPPAAC